MPDNEPGNKSRLPIASLVALASMAMGLILYQSSLKSDRPGDVRLAASAIAGPQVLARLWEDPFEAVARHQKSEASDPQHVPHEHSLTKLQQQISDHQQPITVMAVMVERDPYAEGKEQRLRKRYAVLSALGEAGYAPVNGELIDYFDSGENTQVPYEWYKSSARNGANDFPKAFDILIVWLSDDWAYRHPGEPRCRVRPDVPGGFLQDIAKLVCQLRPTREGTAFPRLRILGPTESGMVRQWVNEATRLGERPRSTSSSYVKNYLTDATIYSYSATAHPALLYSDPEDPPILDTKGESDKFRALGIQFERTISTDRELAEALVTELQQRDVDLPTEKTNQDILDHIALIAEWDTFYGRALPLTFKSAAQEKATGRSFLDCVKDVQSQLTWPKTTPTGAEPQSWIHSYLYLRGLDGMTSGKAATASETMEEDSKKPSHGKQQHRLDSAYLERSEGQNQFDYIRRLAMSIERDNEQLKREGKRFRAIGILGSDVYDKLLILQALRKSFSNVIFFTTDLDARLAHPDEFDWSRNLVIASPYGLELNLYWQKGIPPFRSSYQTALFLSTLRALDIEIPAPDKADAVRLFEIGRRGPVDLPRGSARQVASDLLHQSGWLLNEHRDGSSVQSIHPSPSPGLAKPSTIITALLVPSVLLCMLVVISRHYQRPTEQLSPWDFVRCLIGSFIIAVLLYVFMHLQLEPFSILDGVSIWPTEFLRIVVILLSLYFLWHAKVALAEGERQISDRFRLKNHALTLSGDRISPRVLSWKDVFSGSGRTQHKTNDIHAPSSMDMISLWHPYLMAAHWRNRMSRVVWMVAFALMLAAMVMNLFDPPFVPVRGSISRWSDRTILFLAILVTTVLLFVILDASLLAARLIRQCTEAIPIWPQAALQVCGETCPPGTDLHARLTIQFIGMLTGVIGKLLYYPFIAVALLIAARSRYFDCWDFPIGLLIVFGMNLSYALASTVILRAVAERARTTALARVREQLSSVTGEPGITENDTKRIQKTIEEIKKTQEGAFASFLYQPAFGASLIPTSGITLLALLEYFLPGK